MVIRGACEEVGIRLNAARKPFAAWRRTLSQREIARFSRHEFPLAVELVVAGADRNDFSGIEPLLEEPEVKRRLDEVLADDAPQGTGEEETAETPAEEQAEDRLSEEIAAAPAASADGDIDVPRLWRALIDVENELSTEGVAQLDSVFDRQAAAHRVPVELESGEFDYQRDDTVAVERQDRKGAWRRIRPA